MYLARSSPTVLTWFMDASSSGLQRPHSGTPRPPGASTPSQPLSPAWCSRPVEASSRFRQCVVPWGEVRLLERPGFYRLTPGKPTRAAAPSCLHRQHISSHVALRSKAEGQTVAPMGQGANSAEPASYCSLLVRSPEATCRMRSKIRCPASCTVSWPSRMVPQLMSMSSSMRWKRGVLVAILIDGEGLQPNTLPRPVVKQTRFAPPATCPVAATGSKPGVSMNTKPFWVTGSAYFTTSTRFVLPAFAIAPSDFSRMVVSPPALLPGDGLALISSPCLWVYSSHHRIRSTSFSPTSRLTARRVKRCSAPYVSVVSARIAVPPLRTTRSLATPRAGFAETPEYPSEPPHCRATLR